jgi:hypothetical protein
MTAILVRFQSESVKLDDVEEPRVLTALEVIYEGGSLHGKTATARWLGSTGVVGISLKLMSAQSASIFAAGERFFATPASLLNPTTSVAGRDCSRRFASANCMPSKYKILLLQTHVRGDGKRFVVARG